MQITHQDTVLEDGSQVIRGATTMEVMKIGGEMMLYAHSLGAGGTMSGLQSFGDAGGAFTPEGSANGSYSWTQGLGVPAGMIYVTVDGVPQLVMTGSTSIDVASYDIGKTGQLGEMRSLTLAQGPDSPVQAMAAITIDGRAFIFASHAGDDGIWGYLQTADGTYASAYQSSASAQGDIFQAALEGDLTAVAVVSAGNSSFLATASRSDNSVTLWSVSESGALGPLANLGAATGLGLDEPTALVSLSVAGNSFLVVAGAGSSSISVLEVRPNGSLIAADHVIDGLSTRFKNITELEVVTMGEQVFLFVAGGDDGVSVFSVLPGGRLLHRGSLADSGSTSLDSVSSLAVAEDGGTITLFVSSSTEAGISRFQLTPDAGGNVREGSDGNNTLNGTTQGDILAGGAGHDVLSGGGGDDILYDGTGLDIMRGGAGADIFVFTADGDVDRVLDYNWQQDRLDLSGLGMVYDMTQIQITSTSAGATLTFGTDRIEVLSHNGQSLTAANFSNATLLDAQHTPVGNVAANLNVTGTAGNDTLMGGPGEDRLDGGAGRDSYDGRAGYDTVSYASATQRIVLDLDAPARNRSDAIGDGFERIEAFEGSGYRDKIFGSENDEVLLGGRQGDLIRGRSGNDTINGGVGNDRLYGDAGADILTGGEDNNRDLFVYASQAHSRAGAANRDVIADFHAGEDVIDLRRIDPDSTQSRNQAFTFIGDADFTETIGELRFSAGNNVTLVQADLDGDAQVDFEIELRGQVTLGQDDFML